MGINLIPKTKNFFWIYLLPIILFAIIGIRYFFGELYVFVAENSMIKIPFLENLIDKFWFKNLGLICMGVLSYFMFYVFNSNKTFSYLNALPLLFYSILTIGIFALYGISYYVLSALCIVWAIHKLNIAIFDSQSNTSIFDFAFLISLSVLFSPKLVILIPWAIFVLIISDRVNIKDFTALLLGIIAPIYFLCVYYYLTDQLSNLPEIFYGYLTYGVDFFSVFPKKLPIFISLGFVMMLIVFNTIRNYSLATVNNRRIILSQLTLFLFSIVSIFIIPFDSILIVSVIAIPMTFLMTQYFTSYRSVMLANFLFVIILLSGVLLYLIDYF